MNDIVKMVNFKDRNIKTDLVSPKSSNNIYEIKSPKDSNNIKSNIMQSNSTKNKKIDRFYKK